jgi:hypothetical protein
MQAATVPDRGGEPGARRVPSIAHAVTLSEAASALNSALHAAIQDLMARHGKPATDAPFKVRESDSPDGPWTDVPGRQIVGLVIEGNAARLVAAFQSAAQVTAFAVRRWNALQAATPGGPHQRYFAGDVIPAQALDALESARGMLDLYAPTQPPSGNPPDNAGEDEPQAHR